MHISFVWQITFMYELHEWSNTNCFLPGGMFSDVRSQLWEMCRFAMY